MSRKGKKTSRLDPVVLSRWTFDHLPSDLHRLVAAEMLEAGRLVIVPDRPIVDASTIITSGRGPEVRALSSVGGA